MRILVAYRGMSHAKGWATGEHLIKAFAALGHDARPYGWYYQSGRNPVEGAAKFERDVDLIVYLESYDGEGQYLELADRGSIPLVYWDFDTSLHPGWTGALCRGLRPDILFLANKRLLGAFPGSQYLPYGVDPDLFCLPPNGRYGAAILGSRFAERVAFADSVQVPIIGGLAQPDYARALGSLQLSIHHYDSGGDGLLVCRIWETLSCGTCLLCPDSEELRDHFEPGRHLFTYRDAADCRRIIDGLSAEKCAAIGAAGRAEILAHHTYQHRARTILEAL